MTTSDVLAALARRWWVVLVGLAATAWLCHAVADVRGVWSSTVDVTFIAPTTESAQSHGDTYRDLVSMAGLVGSDVNADRTITPPVSPDVTITGMGVYDGSLTVLPNYSGQFVTNFDYPVLRVQASGRSAAEADRRRDAAVGRIDEALARLQAAQGVKKREAIRTELAPPSPAVTYVHGNRSRALLTAGAVGVVVTVVLATQVDQLLRRRRRPAAVRSAQLAGAAPPS